MMPSVISNSSQQVSFSIQWENQTLFLSAIYAATTYSSRRQLWNELIQLQTSHIGPWCFLGDFNAILGAHEHRGRCLPSQLSCDEFKSWSDSFNLTHLPTSGALYRWSNGKGGNALTEKRLDRVICNDAWIDSWSSISCCTLTRSKSDHYPILLSLQKHSGHHKSSFKFLRIWSHHEDYIKIVSDS